MQHENLVILGSDNKIVGLFKNPTNAEHIYTNLLMQGYSKDEISLILSDETRKTYFFDQEDVSTTDLGNKALEGVGVGSIVGGTVGGIAAAIAAIGTSLVVPALGFVVAGSVAAALAGAGAGAAAGALVGALVGWGIPDDKAQMLEDEIKKGGVVIAVRAKSEDERAILEDQWSSLETETLPGAHMSNLGKTQVL